MRTDHFTIIIEILEKIAAQLNEYCIDWSKFNASALNMTEPHWHRMMAMMQDEGLVKGYEYMGDREGYCTKNIRITLKGLQYLRDNKPR